MKTVRLPWAKTSELSGNARGSWQKRARLVKAQRRTADALAREAGMRRLPEDHGGPIPVTLTYHPPLTVSRVDADNIVSANKGALDAIAAVLGVDDSRFVLTLMQGAPVKGGAVVVTVSEGAE